MIFNTTMIDKLKNSDIAIHLKNEYRAFFGENENNKLIAGGFQFCTDKFICVKNNTRDINEKFKPFFILVNIDNIIAIEMMPHEDD